MASVDMHPMRVPAESEPAGGTAWRLAPWNETNAELVPVVDAESVRRGGFSWPPPDSTVIGRFAAAWPACRWTLAEVAERVGPRPLPVVRVRDGLLGYGKYSGMEYEQKPFRDFVLDLSRGDEPEWFLQLNPDEHLPELVPDLETPACSLKASWQNRMLTIAGAGTTTPIHRELADNVFTVFCGTKEVVLFRPSDTPHLYGFGVLSGVPHLSAVDPRRHDPARHPRLHCSTPLRCLVGAGDALLIPGGWWHAVHTIEPSIALGSWSASGVRSLIPRAATLYKWLFRIKT